LFSSFLPRPPDAPGHFLPTPLNNPRAQSRLNQLANFIVDVATGEAIS
jgi:hypothetical protein